MDSKREICHLAMMPKHKRARLEKWQQEAAAAVGTFERSESSTGSPDDESSFISASLDSSGGSVPSPIPSKSSNVRKPIDDWTVMILNFLTNPKIKSCKSCKSIN